MNLFRTLLTEDEIENLCEHSVFSPFELASLFERYKYIDRRNTGTISYGDLIFIPEFSINPLSKLLINAVERYNHFEGLTFNAFVFFMEIFHEKTSTEKRIEFVFNCLDKNNKKKIERKTLLEIYTLINGNTYDKDRAKLSIDNVMTLYSTNRNYLSKKDFTKYYKLNNLDRIFVFKF